MKKRILTGDRPSGMLHLGHYAGSLASRVALQENYEQFVMIADVQALTDNFEDSSKIKNHILSVCKAYLATGIDPSKTTIFIQSKIPQIQELTIYYMNLVIVARLERNPTVKQEIMQKSLSKSLPAGFLCYPINQAADITIFDANLVPVGKDQLPMIEQTNEIVRKFNRIYKCSILKECEAYLAKSSRLSGIDGKAKASKSLNNAIFLDDTEDVIAKKVKAMYTDQAHLKIEDPGKIEGNVVFEYLDAFYKDVKMIEDLKAHYKKGGLADSKLKNILTDILIEFLKPIRYKINNISDDEVIDILKKGSIKAYESANKKIEEIKNIMNINYF